MSVFRDTGSYWRISGAVNNQSWVTYIQFIPNGWVPTSFEWRRDEQQLTDIIWSSNNFSNFTRLVDYTWYAKITKFQTIYQREIEVNITQTPLNYLLRLLNHLPSILSPFIKMFCGLTSKWAILFLCINCKAFRISFRQYIVCDSVKLPSMSNNNCNSPPWALWTRRENVEQRKY